MIRDPNPPAELTEGASPAQLTHLAIARAKACLQAAEWSPYRRAIGDELLAAAARTITTSLAEETNLLRARLATEWLVERLGAQMRGRSRTWVVLEWAVAAALMYQRYRELPDPRLLTQLQAATANTHEAASLLAAMRAEQDR